MTRETRHPYPSRTGRRRAQRARYRLLLAMGTLAGLLWAPAAAQDEPEFPHGQLQEDCSLCHSSERWKPAEISPGFRHRKQANFSLKGAHRTADCLACHDSLDFSLAEPGCVSCHEDIHQGELGMDCSRCHTMRNFIEPVKMRQAHRLTRFPLRGAHAAVDCNECHDEPAQGNLVYVNRNTECVACHLDDYETTTNPAHQDAGFSTDCMLCHRPTTWEQADTSLAHQGTDFPLRGAHAALDCFDCHTGGFGEVLSSDCVSCHLDDYQGTVNPDHVAATFPTDCEQCHGTVSWTQGAGFPDHDALFFPIFSGKHKGRLNTCTDCHSGGNLSSFTCLQCHAHDNESKVAEDHEGISGYVYESQACFSCHPRGDD